MDLTVIQAFWTVSVRWAGLGLDGGMADSRLFRPMAAPRRTPTTVHATYPECVASVENQCCTVITTHLGFV